MYFKCHILIECPSGKYGQGCVDTCKCFNNAKCDHRNGSCNCTTGWIGTSCDKSCQEGFYGGQCVNKCDCRNGASCDHVTGECICKIGFDGEKLVVFL